MSQLTLYVCDVCSSNTDVDHIGPLAVGNTVPRMIDMCKSCQEIVGLATVTRLFDDYGQPLNGSVARVVREPKSAPRDCPLCGKTIHNGRPGMITHLVTAKHGLDKVAASRLVPPDGPAAECPECTMLIDAANGVTAMAVHNRAAHPDLVKAS